MDDAADALFVHCNEAFCHGRPGDISVNSAHFSFGKLRILHGFAMLGQKDPCQRKAEQRGMLIKADAFKKM